MVMDRFLHYTLQDMSVLQRQNDELAKHMQAVLGFCNVLL